MKNLFILKLLITSLLFANCNKVEEVNHEKNKDEGIISLSRELNVSQITKSEEIAIITIIYDTDNEVLIDCIIPQIILNKSNLSKENIIAIINEKVNNADSATTKSSLKDCIQDCNENFTLPDGTKIKGRGACKANCWLSLLIDELPLIV